MRMFFTAVIQLLARQDRLKNKILLKLIDLWATNQTHRLATPTYLEEVSLGVLAGPKESNEEKTRTL